MNDQLSGGIFLVDKSRNPGRIYEGLSETGTLPPKLISYKDLCPAPNCPSTNCSEVRCKETQVNLYDLVKHFEMKPFIGTHYVGLQNRTLGMWHVWDKRCRTFRFHTSQLLLFCIHVDIAETLRHQQNSQILDFRVLQTIQ